MGAWDTILKYGGKAMKGMGKAANATGKSAGHAVLHPSQTLRGAGQAVKTATAGAAVGYVGWEKLTTDKSVARIVSEAVVGKSATDALAGTTEDMKELKDKAGETVSAIGEAVGGADSKLNGVSNFLREASGGGLFNMLSGFLRNLGGGNVSGLNIAGLIAAAYLVFGRFGWLGKNRRSVSGHDAYRQQCGRCPHGSLGNGIEDTDADTLSGGTNAKRRNEKIETRKYISQ